MEGQYETDVTSRLLNAHLQEALDKVLWECSLWVFFGTEVLEDVGQLFPEVEGFLD